MTITYVMQALENYDPATAAELASNTQGPLFSLDPSNIACGYDFSGRNLMYLGFTSSDITIVAGNPTFTNPSGHTLFNGATYVIAPGGTANLNVEEVFWPQVCVKNIDTGAVTFHSTYDSTKTVPSGVGSVYIYLSAVGSGYTHATLVFTGGSGWAGEVLLDAGGGGYGVNVAITQWGTGTPSFSVTGDGTGMTIGNSTFVTPSDGTWRWIASDFTTSPFDDTNTPAIIDPRTGDFWAVSASCEVYPLKASDNFAQAIAPAKIATQTNPFHNPVPVILGIDSTWVYCTNRKQPGGVANNLDFVLVPVAEQSDETSAATKLTYVLWDTSPFSSDAGVRATFDTGGDVYILSWGPSGTNKYHWRLTKYAPPTLTAFGSNAPGTMTDLTASLWNTSGPNADGANYDQTTYSTLLNGSLMFALCRLPATNQAAAVLKFPKEASSSPSDYTKTLFSCLYMTFGGSPSYDYHSGFVTGYMDASWTSVGSIPTTGWAVLDCRETNNYLEQSDHIYAGVDYTKRWFVFQCLQITGGVVDPDGIGQQAVLVEYGFVSGSPPTVLTVYTDTSWIAAYPTYYNWLATNHVFGGVVGSSMLLDTVLTFGQNFNDTQIFYPDPGIYDSTTNTFWFSGLSMVFGSASNYKANTMFYLDSAFSARGDLNTLGSQATYGPITPPFLKLSFGSAAATGKGHLYKRSFFA